MSKPLDTIWFDGEPPPGAKLEGQWQWDQPGHNGKVSMVRTGKGVHKHSFTGATKSLYINAGDKLITYVYLDPKDPPKSIMLQYRAGGGDHRAIWGDSKGILPKTPTDPRLLASPLPPTGKWVRLEIEAERLGLPPDTYVDGMTFTQMDGTVYYDQPGIQSVPADDRHLRSVVAWEPRRANGTFLPTRPPPRSHPKARRAKTKILYYYVRNVAR